MRNTPGLFGFLFKADYPPVLVDLHYAQGGCHFLIYLNRCNSTDCILFPLESEHFRVVHLVDMVSGEDEEIVWGLLFDKIYVLIYCIGGTCVPLLADTLLGRDRDEEFVQLGIKESGPSEGQVTVQRERFVLRYDRHLSNVGIETVAQCEIDYAVFASERDCGLCTVDSKGMQALALAAGQNNCQHILHLAILFNRRHIQMLSVPGVSVKCSTIQTVQGNFTFHPKKSATFRGPRSLR